MTAGIDAIQYGIFNPRMLVKQWGMYTAGLWSYHALICPMEASSTILSRVKSYEPTLELPNGIENHLEAYAIKSVLGFTFGAAYMCAPLKK